MIYQLECRHIDICQGWPPNRPRCKKCEAGKASLLEGRVYQQVIAIECREWKVTCFRGCKWARWYGQDKSAANLAASRHKHPGANVDYLRHPDTYARMRREWPRRIKPFVIYDTLPGISARRDQNMPHPVIAALRVATDPFDKPPF